MWPRPWNSLRQCSSTHLLSGTNQTNGFFNLDETTPLHPFLVRSSYSKALSVLFEFVILHFLISNESHLIHLPTPHSGQSIHTPQWLITYRWHFWTNVWFTSGESPPLWCREILNEMADNIKVLVDKEMEAIRQKSKLPITMLVGEYVVKNRKTMTQVCLLVSVPVIVYLSSQASQSMRQSSRIFDEQVFVSLSLFGLHTRTHMLTGWRSELWEAEDGRSPPATSPGRHHCTAQSWRATTT